MKMSLDCIPCFIRQALEASRMISDDPALHEKIMRETLQWACEVDLNEPAPTIGQRIHRRLREITGSPDPYRQHKDHQNKMALSMLPKLRKLILSADNPIDIALRVAIAGNVIDMGIPGNITNRQAWKSIENALSEPLIGNQSEFIAALSKAKNILYLADNAGEIAFDRLLIEQLDPKRVTVVVRGGPAINDATILDARAVGMHELTEIIDNGSDAPGTLLADCNPQFLKHFKEADIIIAKGQGNFETLSEEPGNIFFLFKAKCRVIAEHAAVKIGSHVITRRYQIPSLIY